MEIFQAKLRGSHAKAVENIMSRTTGSLKLEVKERPPKSKGEDIATYIRKFEIDRENLNLAKRILLCESEHNHKYYEKEWKKTENFLRVRSNFKRGLANEEPRIFKFETISGKGNTLITLTFSKFESNPIHFRPDNLYSLRALIAHNSVNPTNSTFKLSCLSTSPMSFYIPTWMRKKKIVCKVSEIKENEMYDKGKLTIDLANKDTEQQIAMINKQGKEIATVHVKVSRESKPGMKKKQSSSALFSQRCNKENSGI